MTQKRQIYTCKMCGNMVEVLRAGAGTLVCCNQPMTPQEENSTDATEEKHVPVIEKAGHKVNVSVGSVAHPMDDDHYIEWIELGSGESVSRRHLVPGDRPEAAFDTPDWEVTARAYCNLHGLWKS